MLSSVSKSSSIRAVLPWGESLTSKTIWVYCWARRTLSSLRGVSSCVIRHLPQVYNPSACVSLPPCFASQASSAALGVFSMLPVFLFYTTGNACSTAFKISTLGSLVATSHVTSCALWCLLGIPRCPAEVEPCKPKRRRATVGPRRAKCSS